MDRNDQQAIETLFGKLADVERQAQPRDPEAEAFIAEQLRRQPGAPYYMAQTIVVQEQALEAAQSRIEELEAAERAPSGGGGFLGGLFGGEASRAPRSGTVPRIGSRPAADGLAAGASRSGAPQRGGGFLAGAAQTAMGVAGGVLLGSAIAGLIGGGEAEAAEPTPQADEPVAEDAGFDDAGDFGDFDL